MDLEEFRQAYMRSESLGNTPANLIRRMAAFSKSLISIPFAANKDAKEREYKKYERKKIYEKIKNDGVSVKAIIDLIKNKPGSHKNTSRAISELESSGIGMLKSSNELGQTAAQAVELRNKNSSYYDQDVEKGVHFILVALDDAKKAMCMPKNLLNTGKTLIFGNPKKIKVSHLGVQDFVEHTTDNNHQHNMNRAEPER